MKKISSTKKKQKSEKSGLNKHLLNVLTMTDHAVVAITVK